MIECKDVDYILAIAKYQTVSAAAGELHISQPALTKYLKSLENRLDIVLFDRSRKKLVFTIAGKQYLHCAAEVAASRNRLEQEMLRLKSKERGLLRVGFASTGMRQIVFSAMEELHNKMPLLELHFHELTSPNIEEMLLSQELDLGFITLPSPRPELHTEMLLEENILLGVPAKHPLCVRTSRVRDNIYPWIDISLFHDESFVLRNNNTRFREVTDRLLKQHNVVPKIIMTTRNQFSTIEFSESHNVLFFIPESFAKCVHETADIKFFLVGSPITKLPSGVAYLKEYPLTTPALDFLHIMNRILQDKSD